VRAGAGCPATAVDPALERGAGFGGAEGEAGSGVVRGVGRVRVDGRVRGGQVDRPGVARRRGIGVASDVGRADVKGVAAGCQSRRDGGRARAAGPAAAVDPALEGGAALRGAEGEAGRGVVRRIGRARIDGRVRRARVDDPGVARRSRIGVTCRIDRSHVEGVTAVRECR